jgi:hypothetical protein
VAQLFFEKLGPGVPPEAATFVGLAVHSLGALGSWLQTHRDGFLVKIFVDFSKIKNQKGPQKY